MGIVDEILNDAEPENESRSPWIRWLDSNPEEASVFWDAVKRGRERGIPFSRIVRAFRAHYPSSPQSAIQTLKAYADDKLGS